LNTEKAQSVLDLIETSVNALAEETDAFRQSEQWRQILTTMSRFHSYSAQNQLLIAYQRPDAKRVAGFQTWKSLNRHVVKGAKGIAILAPMVFTNSKKSDKPAQENNALEANKAFVRFRTVFVFDEADTDGEPLNTLALPAVSDDNGKLSLVRTAVESLGIHVRIEPITTPGLQGYSKGGGIVIRESLPAGDMASVLIHEASHELLHQGEHKQRGNEIGTTMREIEAESAAYSVMHYLGIESTANLYLTSYGANGKAIKASLAHIRNAVSKMIAAIEDIQKAQAQSAVDGVELPLAA